VVQTQTVRRADRLGLQRLCGRSVQDGRLAATDSGRKAGVQEPCAQGSCVGEAVDAKTDGVGKAADAKADGVGNEEPHPHGFVGPA